MEILQEYERRKKEDVSVWRSLPTIIGYWFWLIATVYFWHFRLFEIDLSASIGLGIGIAIWILSHFVLGIMGIDLITTNLWENLGCGCLAKIVAIPLLPYVGILTLIIWAHRVGSVGTIESIISFIVGWLDWFLLSYLDT